MKVLSWAIALLVATSGVAEAAPVAGLVAAVSGWFTGTFGAAIGGFLMRTAASVALSALSMAIRGKPKVPQPGITTQTTTAGGVVPQRLIFGTYATGGQHVCPPMVYQTDGNPNEWLVYVISLADKPITALNRIIVNGRALTIDGSPAATGHTDAMGATVLDSGDDSLRDKLYVRFHNGRQTAADAYLMRVFATYPERPWLADMIGTGVPYVVLTFKGKAQDGDYQGFPQVKFEVDGHALYDPRDATQNPANEATWKFTRNPAVIAYNILRGIDIPGGDRWGIGTRKFLMSYVLAAANLCDENVPLYAGGTRKRYEANLEIGVDQEPHEALTEVLKAMGGDVADMGGTWLARAGPPAGPVLSITDDDIIVTDSRSLRPYPGLAETVNAIHASYPDPGQQWEAKEAVPLYDAALEAKDGGRRLIADVNFPAVTNRHQVRALMREMLADHRRHRVHVITLPPDACGLRLVDHVAWSSIENGYNGKLFKVGQMRIDPVSLCVAVTLTERDPADYDYDAGSDGRVPTIPSVVPVVPVLRGVFGWAVEPVNAGGKPGIRMSWDATIRAQAVSWTIRLQSDLSVVNRGSISDVRAGYVVLTEGLRPSTTYLVSGRLVLPRRTEATQEIAVTTFSLRIVKDDLDEEVLSDVDTLTDWMDGTGPFLRDLRDDIADLRDSIAEVDWGNYTIHNRVRREASAEVAEARAEFVEEINVAASATEAVATRVTALTATVEDNTAAITQEQLARANADGALAIDIQTVSAAAGSNAAAITQERLARISADEALAADITSVESSLGTKASASAVTALTTRVADTEAGITAQSDAITQVQARTNRGTASGLLRVAGAGTPTGTQARIGLRAEATFDDTSHSAALFLEANSDGTSAVTVVADRFAIVQNTAASSARSVPFIVQGGAVYMDIAFIRDLEVDTIKIKGGALSQVASASIGTTTISSDAWVSIGSVSITPFSAESRLLIGGQFDGTIPPSGGVLGSGQQQSLYVRVLLNGVQKDIMEISHEAFHTEGGDNPNTVYERVRERLTSLTFGLANSGVNTVSIQARIGDNDRVSCTVKGTIYIQEAKR